MSVGAKERKTALDLFPYFSKTPIVFDVGSNKGEWSDLFIDTVSEIHLFEPNTLLLHYTMVKYCDRSNIRFNDFAVADSCKVVEFTFFTNENNGLSNIISNPKWNYLPFKKELIDCSTLDIYWQNRDEDIDILKIDIEGAEYMALQGAKKLLEKKRIKFLQLENAEHIHNTGKTFQDVVEYLKTFGYVPLTDLVEENIIFMQEGFTQDWNREFKKNTEGMKADFALEIGAFEGLTSRYICDNILNPGGRMIVIDPLTDEYLPGHEDNALFVGQFDRFTRNTKGYPIELIRKKSIDAYAELEHYRFDLIYIDGDHTENAVFLDGLNAFRLCKVGGFILFDDYEWRDETKRGIDRVLETLMGKYELRLKGYQVMIKKLEN